MNEKHPPIYTIGYGARDIEPFITVLKDYQITFLLDIRSKPYSSYKPDFSKKSLADHLNKQGIRYVFMGDTLGGQPEDPDCFDEDGKVDYDKIKGKPFFLQGIERVKKAWQQQLSVVLMCSEGKPEMCHRYKLIAPALIDKGVAVEHIDEKDQRINQEDVKNRKNNGQLSLFPDNYSNLKSRKKYRGRQDES